MRRRPPALLAALLLAAALVTACGDGGAAAPTTAARPATGAGAATDLSGSVTVSAAASLTAAFTTIRDDSTRANPGVTVTLNTGSSGQLATQLEQGAPADVAAFADRPPMDRLVAAGLVLGTPTVFATNRLVVVTRPGNPSGVRGLADLPEAGVVALCAPGAPCGDLAARALADAGVSLDPSLITRAPDATSTLAAVTQGDADAAIVYATDARAAGDAVTTVAVPEAEDVVAEYPIAVVTGPGDRAAARALRDWVVGPAGQRVLRAAGFGAP